MILKIMYRIEHFDHSLHIIWTVSFKNVLKHK